EPLHWSVWPLRHSTQTFADTSQTGVVVPSQSFLLPCVHFTHFPVGRSHAGASTVGQRSDPPVLLSPWQGTHVPPLQTGVVPPQSLKLRHWTQCFDPSQNGLPGTAPQFPSPRHSTQTPATLSQTGVGAAHWASSVQDDLHS